MSKKENLYYSEDRDDRVKDTGEVFTPSWLVSEMIDNLCIDWDNPPQDKTFLDPTCGSGNFLVELAKRNIPIKNIYGVDLMPDNVTTTKKRLIEIFGNTKANNEILDHNIRQGDATEYDYSFSSILQGSDTLFGN